MLQILLQPLTRMGMEESRFSSFWKSYFQWHLQNNWMMSIESSIPKLFLNQSSMFSLSMPFIQLSWRRRHIPCRKRLLATDQVEELRALFCIYDRDGSGMIDMDELLEALPSVGYSADDFQTLFSTYDVDKNGLLDVDEFLNLMADVFQWKSLHHALAFRVRKIIFIYWFDPFAIFQIVMLCIKMSAYNFHNKKRWRTKDVCISWLTLVRKLKSGFTRPA